MSVLVTAEGLGHCCRGRAVSSSSGQFCNPELQAEARALLGDLIDCYVIAAAKAHPSPAAAEAMTLLGDGCWSRGKRRLKRMRMAQG